MKIGVKLSLINAAMVIIVMSIGITFYMIKDIKQRNNEVLKNCKMLVKEFVSTREYLAESLGSFGEIDLDVKMAHFVPAKAGYGIGKKFTQETGYILKQTSLKLRNPDNAPDELERRILKMFEDDKKIKEYWEIEKVHQDKYFRYMYPLVIEDTCMKCHGDKDKIPIFIKVEYKQDTATGYKLGDIRGAISLKVPYERISKSVWGGFWHLTIVTLVVTSSCIGLVFFLSKIFVSLPFKKLCKVVREIAGGNLRQKIEVKSNDEIGDFSALFNTMTDNLIQLVNKNKEVIAQVATSSVEIFSANEEQTSGTGELAASVSEITATMEELSASASQIASNAEMVNKFTGESKNAAQQGKDAVMNSVATMENIVLGSKETVARILSLNEKSRQIGTVLKIINDVSHEIHLLSLNAAIEASGAGEHGRRFGVVANEVRRLAERTKASTEEIRGIIEEVQAATNVAAMSTEQETKNVKEGMEIATMAAQGLERILETIEKTSDASRQIVMATQQQKSASEQVALTMKEITGVVNQTVSGLKQSNTALSELNRFAKDLSEKIKEFKT
ncbi:MAG: methyl-accepting chemotaxis protein [Candidatus Brocadiaceae bacterium]